MTHSFPTRRSSDLRLEWQSKECGTHASLFGFGRIATTRLSTPRSEESLGWMTYTSTAWSRKGVVRRCAVVTHHCREGGACGAGGRLHRPQSHTTTTLTIQSHSTHELRVRNKGI